MSFPTYDIAEGLKLNAEGTDLEVYWPKDDQWYAAVIRAALWQIKGQWKYNLEEGIDLLDKVLGQVPDIRVVQELFRRRIAPYVTLSKLRVYETEKGVLQVDWAGPKNSQISGTISLVEPDLQQPAYFVGGKTQDNMISLMFSGQLDPHTGADLEAFRISYADVLADPEKGEIFATDIAVKNNHVFLTLPAPVASTTVRTSYLGSSANPLIDANQREIAPFTFDH